MPKPLSPDQVEQAVFKAVKSRIAGDHAVAADPHLKGSIHIDPAALDAGL